METATETDLVERSSYLEALSDRYASAEKGKGNTVFLAGEAGGGKTSLIHHFLKRLHGTALIYSGACDSLFTPRPLGPLYDVAQQIGTHFLELLRNEKERAVVFASFLQEISVSKLPVILVFEDVHWADEATIDFIKFFARRINRFRCLFVITYRPDEIHARHGLKNIFGELPSGDFTKMVLQPLSREAVDLLVLAKGYASGANVYSLTGGNPFYVSEILASYSPGIPERVKDSILAVFHSRPEETQVLWEYISIVPAGISFSLWKQIENEFPKGMEEHIVSGIIVERNGRYHFKHELYRITIEGSLSVYRRKNLHGKMLKLMQDNPEYANSIPQLIHHARLAEDRDWVAKLAPRAAQEAALLGAHVEASKLYEIAIEYTGEHDPDKVTLYERHAYECYLTNQMMAAIRSQRQAVQIWKDRKVSLKVGDTLRFLSRILWFQGKCDEVDSLAMEAVEALENGFPTRERALAYSNVSQLAMLADDVERTLEWGNKAIELAQRMDDPEVQSHALNNVGGVLMKFTNTYDEGVEKLNQSLAIALKHGFHEHAARAYTNLSSMSVLSKKYHDAENVFEAGLKYCEELDLNSWVYYMRSERIRLMLETGDIQSAEAIATQLYNNAQHPLIIRIGAIAVLIQIKTRRGEFAEAKALIDEGKPMADITGEAHRIVPILSAEMQWCWITGSPLPEKEVSIAENTLFRIKDYSWQYTDLSYWKRKCGLPVSPEIRYNEPFRLENDGQWKDAADQWLALGCPYEAALSWMEGDEEHCRKGLMMLEELGATSVSEMFKSKMKLQGVKNIPRGPRESTRNNPAQLTGRQVDVLELLKEGLQNNEIADRLFISPKTVDHHISAILSKLEVNTRAKAVLEAQRLGILK